MATQNCRLREGVDWERVLNKKSNWRRYKRRKNLREEKEWIEREIWMEGNRLKVQVECFLKEGKQREE